MDRGRTDNTSPAVVLSSPETMRRVHSLRANVAAIMVGTQTAFLDNPSLTVRHWVNGNSPVRVVLDRTLRIPSHYHLFDGTVKTLVFTAGKAENRENVEYVTPRFSQPVLPQVMHELYIRKLNSLDGGRGAVLLEHFLEENLWDQIFVETAPSIWNRV